MKIWERIPSRIARFAAIGAIGVAPLASAAPATAATPPLPGEATGFYLLMVEPQSTAGANSSAVLECGPDGGTHPNAATACGQLFHTEGDVATIPMGSGICPMIWMPVKVTAVGVWNGEPRYYEHTFPNRCLAIRATGGVIFAF